MRKSGFQSQNVRSFQCYSVNLNVKYAKITKLDRGDSQTCVPWRLSSGWFSRKTTLFSRILIGLPGFTSICKKCVTKDASEHDWGASGEVNKIVIWRPEFRPKNWPKSNVFILHPGCPRTFLTHRTTLYECFLHSTHTLNIGKYRILEEMDVCLKNATWHRWVSDMRNLDNFRVDDSSVKLRCLQDSWLVCPVL